MAEVSGRLSKRSHAGKTSFSYSQLVDEVANNFCIITELDNYTQRKLFC